MVVIELANATERNEPTEPFAGSECAGRGSASNTSGCTRSIIGPSRSSSGGARGSAIFSLAAQNLEEHSLAEERRGYFSPKFLLVKYTSDQFNQHNLHNSSACSNLREGGREKKKN